MWVWLYRRIFASVIVCGVLFGCVLFIRLNLSGNGVVRKPAPEFLPNVPRFRTSRVCSQRALVLVSSSPAHAQRRQVIRETWAHPTVTQSLDISVAFGVGIADSDHAQRTLDWEAEIYGDIFQDYSDADTGSKSASRIVRLLKIARGACDPPPEFYMKTDEDVFVNTRLLGDFLEAVETYSASNTMWCLEYNRKLDKLGRNETWIVTPSSQSGHPRYCVGVVYLMTGKALDAIIRRHEVQTGKIMLPEDVYVTGILTKEAGTVLSLLGERFAFDDQQEDIDAAKVSFAYLGDKFEEVTNELWRTLDKEKLNRGRRTDVGL